MFAHALMLAVLSVLPADQILVSTDLVTTLPDALVVDTRAAEAYAAGHVPGAAHLDVDTLSETREGVVGLLKGPANLTKLLEAAGLDPARRIVVYSGMKDAADATRATRMFWILESMSYPRVSLLNGGLAKWAAEKRSMESGASTVAPLHGLLLTPKPELMAQRSEVLNFIQAQDGVLVDCRPPEEYAGLSKKDYVEAAGQIPSAENLPATDLLQGEYFEFKAGPELSEALALAGAKPGQKVITYCNTGRSASVGYLGFRLGGFKKIKLYDGSMAEWSHHPGVKVEEK